MMHERNAFLLLSVIGISVCTLVIWKRYDPLMLYLDLGNSPYGSTYKIEIRRLKRKQYYISQF